MTHYHLTLWKEPNGYRYRIEAGPEMLEIGHGVSRGNVPSDWMHWVVFNQWVRCSREYRMMAN